MKTIKTTISLMLAAVAFTACNSEEEATQPTAKMRIEQDTYNINESMTVHFTGNAENVVIFTGDTGHDYELREESNTGLVVNKGLFTYAYTTPGVYKVVCLVTNHSNEGQVVLRDTCSAYVHVKDDVTEIQRISAPAVFYDEVFAESLGGGDWLMKLPRKLFYKNKTLTVPLTQKLKFYIASSTSKIGIDGADFNSSTKYNLGSTHEISVTSNEGNVANYKLLTLNYAIFKNFSILGKAGTLGYSEYDYSTYTMNVKVPSGSDISAVAPKFTMTADNETAYIDGVEQKSGENKVDFTKPVTYTLVASHPEKPEVKIETKVTVNVTFE
ncbi:MAG: DUF5017 domain-containing protein [Muribaculaceae bacterium]